MNAAAKDENTVIWFFKAGLAYLVVTLVLGALMITGKGYSIFGPQGAKAAHIHAGLLGFVTNIIIGSMYQIVPTMTGTRLYGGRLASKQFYLFNLGVLGLFLAQLTLTGTLRTGFQTIFGITILFASILFAFIVFKTIAESRSKIKPVSLLFFKAATIFLIAGETLGILTVIFPKVFSNMLLAKTAHAHLGILGFITMTIFGAEYQMFPMLTLKKLKSEQWAKINFWTFTVGVAGFFLGLMLTSGLLMVVFAALLVVSTLLFLVNMWQTIHGVKWTGLDVSVKYLLAGQGFLFLTVGAGMLMTLPGRLSTYSWVWTHAHIGLLGFVSLTIIGAMYHLVPMLVWMEKYGPKMGKEKVPNIQDLFSKRLAHIILYASLISILGMASGMLLGNPVVLQASGITMAATATVFTIDMFRVMK
ncbi:cytochrome C and Quinol oxidase polypeptide I [archaeon BMS3Abin16]|nr:cytochrome C and Quinol oxidase polypeptide I [archaeon BMS3Abin16]